MKGLALAVTGVVVMQAILTFFALWISVIFGQDLLSEAREYVVQTVLGLPLGRVESASTGDLVTRVTRDVCTMSMSVRFGLPESVIAGMTTLLTVVAMLLNSPLLTLPLLVTAPLLIIAARRYLKRAPKGYITEGGTYSQINSTFTETVEGARTVEALGLQRNRIERGDEDIAVSAQAERYTMTLRNLLFIVIGFAYDTPLPLVLILGGIGYVNGWVSLGQVTAATLYVQALVEPLDRLIRNIDRLQVGIASTSRLSASPPSPKIASRATHCLPETSWWAGTCASPIAMIMRCCMASTWRWILGSGWPLLGRAAPASPRWAGCCRASTSRVPARSRWVAWSSPRCRCRCCELRSRW